MEINTGIALGLHTVRTITRFAVLLKYRTGNQCTIIPYILHLLHEIPNKRIAAVIFYKLTTKNFSYMKPKSSFEIYVSTTSRFALPGIGVLQGARGPQQKFNPAPAPTKELHRMYDVLLKRSSRGIGGVT